ncbi:hypothetical protein [Nitratifractor sp.]
MINEEIHSLLSDIRSRQKHTKSRIAVGRLSENIVQFLNRQNIVIHTKKIYLTHKGLSHLARHSKRKRGAGLSDADILRIPEIIERGEIYFDKNGGMNIIYCAEGCEKLIKIVVDSKGYTNRKEKITLIKTAGYIEKYNLSQYKKV